MRLKLLLRIILTILVIIVVIIGGLFGLNAYSDQHPNNRSINDWNKLNPLAPTHEYYVKTQNHQKWKSLIRKKTSISIIIIKQVTPKMVKLKTLIIQRLKIKTTSLLSCKRKISHHYII